MICYDAFKNLNIVYQNNRQSFSPCCISPVRLNNKIDFLQDSFLNEVRTTWLTGNFPSSCNACKSAEESGWSSRRINVNNWYESQNLTNTDVELVKIDYWTGDTCNLRCVICGPQNSSSWKQELNLPIKKLSVNQFWKTLDTSSLRLIHFNGGEPLLSKEHITFLQAIPHKSQVELDYNTNGTILPSAELLDLWSKFKLVQLDFSIDDIGERFEYQRFPASWNQVTDNLQWYINNSPVNCMFNVNTSVGILNQANLDNLNLWLVSNFNENRLGDKIKYRQQPVMGIFSLGYKNKQKALDFLNECDKRRGTNWRKVFPELVHPT
jgi:sulfatase maturation enzyme AslB (radical SAM superfamily)